MKLHFAQFDITLLLPPCHLRITEQSACALRKVTQHLSHSSKPAGTI